MAATNSKLAPPIDAPLVDFRDTVRNPDLANIVTIAANLDAPPAPPIPNRGTVQRAVLEHLAAVTATNGGTRATPDLAVTAADISNAIGIALPSVRKRLAELAQLELVERAGKVPDQVLGRLVTTWRIIRRHPHQETLL